MTSSSASKARFHWDDPFLLDAQLTDEERRPRSALAAAYSGQDPVGTLRYSPPCLSTSSERVPVSSETLPTRSTTTSTFCSTSSNRSRV